MAAGKNLTTIAATILLLHGTPAPAQTSWTTFGFDHERTGYNPEETTLSPGNVGGLTAKWNVDLGGTITAQPVLAGNLVYAATGLGKVYALDASTGTAVWSVQLGTTSVDCGDFDQNTVGVIGAPTIDPTNNRIFVVSGDDLLHALDLGTGNELPNYPLQLMYPANNAPRTFVYASPTYSPANNALYLTTASACETTPFHGQVMRVDVTPGSTPKVLRRWFPNGFSGPDGGGIWGPGGVSIGAYEKAVFAGTGNAIEGQENQLYSDHVVRLDLNLNVYAVDGPDLGGAFDIDFGSTPMLYQPPGCPPQLAVMNKNGALYIYNRNAIGSGAMQVLQISVFNSSGVEGLFVGDPVYDPVLNLIYTGNSQDNDAGTFLHGLIALVPQADCTLALAWQKQVGINGGVGLYLNPVTPPIAANGVVYYATSIHGHVYAFDGSTGQQLWDSGLLTEAGIYAAPTVVNGQLFVATFDNKIYAFGLP